MDQILPQMLKLPIYLEMYLEHHIPRERERYNKQSARVVWETRDIAALKIAHHLLESTLQILSV